MKEETRRAIAFTAAMRINQEAGRAVYDFASGQRTAMSGDRNNVFDHEARAHIATNSNGFYHYGTKSNVELNVSGNRFTGRDAASGQRFEGTVFGSEIEIRTGKETRKYSA